MEAATQQDTGSHLNLSLRADGPRAADVFTRALAGVVLLVLGVGIAVVLIPLALVALTVVALYAGALFLGWLIRSRLERWGLIHPPGIWSDGREGVRVVRAPSPTVPGDAAGDDANSPDGR